MNLSIPSLTPDRLAGVSCSSQPMPSGAVFDKPDRVVRSLLNLANARRAMSNRWASRALVPSNSMRTSGRFGSTADISGRLSLLVRTGVSVSCLAAGNGMAHVPGWCGLMPNGS